VFLFRHENQPQNRWASVFPDFIRRALLCTSEDIQEYKVKQMNPQLLEVSIQAEGKEELLYEQVRSRLQEAISQHGAQIPMIQFTPYERVTGGKKMRRVERMFTQSEIE
jgi:hypothetical protein